MFSQDITVAMLVSQNNEMVAMLVFPINLVGVEIFSYANSLFCSNKMHRCWPREWKCSIVSYTIIYYLPQGLLLISSSQFEVQLTLTHAQCTTTNNSSEHCKVLKSTTCNLELQNNDWGGIMVNADLMSTFFLGSIYYWNV